MREFIVALLAVATFVFVAYPMLLRKRKPVVVSDASGELQELYSQRNTTYSMLKELEFDRSSGVLTDEDYRDLESRYKDKAVSILKGIDDRASDGLEDEVERRVRRFRRGKTASRNMSEEIEGRVRQYRAGHSDPKQAKQMEQTVQTVSDRGEFCFQCGRQARDIDRFCRYCGAKLD